MKAMTRIINFVIVLSCTVIIAGCKENTIFLNGEKIDNDLMQQYIDISKLYWGKVYEIGEKPRADKSDKDYESISIIFKANYEKAKKLLRYDENDWKDEYLKMIVVKKELYDDFPVMREQVTQMADDYIGQVKENGTVSYVDGADIDLKQGLEFLSRKCDMTYESYADKIFRAFYEYQAADEIFMSRFIGNGFKGEKVDWNGSNAEDFRNFFTDLCVQYERYKDGLLKNADIKYDRND